MLPDTDPHLPPRPGFSKLLGPFLRLTKYDPATGAYAVSALVVTHQSLVPAGASGPPEAQPPLVQLHFSVHGGAYQARQQLVMRGLLPI